MTEEIKKIEWDDSYLLGIPEIDLQHKKLIAIANELYDVISGDENQCKTSMPKILKKLTDYTVYHFSNEEELMQKIGYIGFNMHKNTHELFIKEVNFQIQNLSIERKSALLAFYKYIASWVFSHIAKADKLWATFKKENGK